MSYNFNRHNSIGGNWNLPPPGQYGPGQHGAAPGSTAGHFYDSLANSPNDPKSNQMPGFRNPWYYSSQSPSLSSPSSTAHSPTKAHQAVPLLNPPSATAPGATAPGTAAAKRLLFTNQLPTTYETDAPGPPGQLGPGQLGPGQAGAGPNFIHPPTRADNPFQQYYMNQEFGPERRMSAAVDTFAGATQANGPVGGPVGGIGPGPGPLGPLGGYGYLGANRRSSVAVAHDARYGNYFPDPAHQRFARSQLIVQYNQYQQTVQHQKSSPRRKPAPRLAKVYARTDLKPKAHQQPKYRRCSVNSIHISPVNALSVYITESYSICQPKKFQYSRTTNPKRVLTKPLEPRYNNGFDNDDSDYILYVNDILGTEEGRKYIVLDLLGSGTFGQVVKCQNLSNQSVCAVKVIKSKPAYMNQSLTEVRLLEYLNKNTDGTNFIKLLDTFMHKEHLCLVFEILASNLYELIKQNQFQGLNMKLVKVLTKQLLESMALLKSFQVIHCDLKPENILLCQPDRPEIKVIDFGLACFTRDAVYSYIQSRFYRSPEVILGLPYTESIDMWSLGCIVGELFLGLPLFPGTSEYNQIWKIADMLGTPPRHMIELGKSSANFFKKVDRGHDKPDYEVKSYEEYLEYLKNSNKEEKLKREQRNKNYFKHKHLKDIILDYKLPSKKMTASMIEKECEERLMLYDLLSKILNMNPLERLTPQEALKHPFVRSGASGATTGAAGTSPSTNSAASTNPSASTTTRQGGSGASKYNEV